MVRGLVTVALPETNRSFLENGPPFFSGAILFSGSVVIQVLNDPSIPSEPLGQKIHL